MQYKNSYAIQLGTMLAFTFLNGLFTFFSPSTPEVPAQGQEKVLKIETIRQDVTSYTQVLKKADTCEKVTDKEENDFYSCPDSTTISMVHWTRSPDRKGVVTKYYDKDKNLLMIYGHPDDVY